jgi:hypothetical protein
MSGPHSLLAAGIFSGRGSRADRARLAADVSMVVTSLRHPKQVD